MKNQETVEEITKIDLTIPDYQRAYKWTVRNAIQLLDDIVEAQQNNKEVYRVGTLILHHDTKGKYNIVDGQQRLVTLSLMLLAFKAEVEKMYDGKKKNIPFLEKEDVILNNPFNKHNISKNYTALERRADSMGAEDVSRGKFVEYLLKNCELVVVVTDDESEAFQFFDSQNARGKKLYPHDLLKAYHLREMSDLGIEETEKIVNRWESLNQGELSALFSEYLHRIKEWSRGNRADELSEKNIDKFKGVARKDSYPYAQFYKGAFAYLESFNRSPLPFVLGTRKLNTFRIDSPIIAGKPFFEYAEHYFEILKDIQNNDKYKGYFVNNNDIVKTLNLKEYRQGAGNRRTRLLFDSAILLYVDRFCPDQPTKLDIEMLDQFVIFCFIWAYSLRAQYESLHWSSVQNYILGNDKKKNSLNIYKEITEAETPTGLICTLSEKLSPLLLEDIRFQKDKVKESELKTVAKEKEKYENLDEVVYKYFLYYFDKYHFLKKSGNQEDNKRSKEEKIQ